MVAGWMAAAWKGEMAGLDQTGQSNPNWKGGRTGSKEARRLDKARYRKRHRDRDLAHKAVQTAIARGKLERGLCEVCGEPNAHAHHDDYSQRLNVRWLCKVHHETLHHTPE
jgi:hypothetical protein